MTSHGKFGAGALSLLVLLALGFGFTAGASAETIKVDIDGDRVKDPVAAALTAEVANTTRVGTLLSKQNDRFTYVDLPGSGATAPFIRAKGNVNRGRGAELFVRSGRYPNADVIAVLTVARGNLVNARNFFVDNALSDGLAMGIRCGTVKGGPGIRAYVFRLGNKGRWNRTVVPYAWKNGSLVRRGKQQKGKVRLPSSTETGIGCPKPAPPPPPPPKLGTAGSKYFTGLGKVEPKSFRARQGSGRYFGLKWSGWGKSRTTARGFLNTGAPGAGKKRLFLTAFDLGTCRGVATYRKLTLRQKGSGGITLGVC